MENKICLVALFINIKIKLNLMKRGKKKDDLLFVSY